MRDFHLLDLGKAVNSSTSLSAKLNSDIERLIPKGRDVHFLQAISHDEHLFVFLREYDPTAKGAAKGAK